MNKLLAVFFSSIFIISVCALAEVSETQVNYNEGQSKLVGYFYTDGSNTPKPTVIVFSDWMGVGQFAKDRAKELVGLGYRAFVADIYGEGHQAKDQKEAGELSTKFKSDRKLLRARARAALDWVSKNKAVDTKKIAAIGFCFGGTTSLELARDGGQIVGLVSFHGGLATPTPEDAKNIKGKVLALHGADDPYVPKEEVQAFEDEMNKGGVNWELVKYGHSVHAFTNPAAGNDNSKGAAYNELAAKRSYAAMGNFLKEVF